MNRPDMSTSESFNPAPGVAVLIMSAMMIAVAYPAGLQIFPFGGVAIASVVVSAYKTYIRRSNAPAYTSLPIALIFSVIGVMWNSLQAGGN